MKKFNAFTLAEVLITLAIIGVVAVLTIPALVKNYNEKAWSTAKDVFEKRLEVAAKQLNTEEKLAGYNSTMDFVNELKKKIKIINVCDSNNLSKCFERTILTADGQEVDAASLKTSAKLAKEDWGTETVGVQFANGINALIAYNPQTDQQPFNNQFSATEASMAILYDVSGHKNPNILGKDVNMNGNVTNLGCLIKEELLDGMCITRIIPSRSYQPLTRAQCQEIADLGYGNNKLNCSSEQDYWAGAVKLCGGTQYMPTLAQLAQLATYLFNMPTPVGATQNLDCSENIECSKSDFDLEKAAIFPKITDTFYSFSIWSGEDRSVSIRVRSYNNSDNIPGSSIGYVVRGNDAVAVCVDN